MPPLAALGAAAMSAVSAVTLTGLATGAAVISAGTGILSQITGSKTLGKISMGFGIASGAGFAAKGISSLKGMNPSTSVGGKGLLETNNIEDILSTPTKGTKAAGASGFKSFNASGTESSSLNGFLKNSGEIGTDASTGMSDMTDMTRSFFERANDTLTKYNPMINLAAGAGQGYIQGQQMDLHKELLDKRLDFDQQLVDRTARNNDTPLNFNPNLNLTRTVNPFPLLRR